MKKLPRIAQLTLCSLFFVLCSASLGSVRAQEAVEIPGPELEDASFTPVGDLEIGDWVFIKGDEGNLVPEQITKLEYHQEEVEVYNLSVEGEETFFANDFAVHNKSGTDTTPPICKVIVNPTISNVDSLVKNRSFESPLWCKKDADRNPCMNCPSDWYNRDDGGKHDDQLWCNWGLAVTRGTMCSGCGNQYVSIGYPEFNGFQIVSGLETFKSNPGGVIYGLSVWGLAGRAMIKFGPGDGQIICRYDRYDCNAGGFRFGSALGWAASSSERIVLGCYKCDEEIGGTAFDLVTLKKLVGKTSVESQQTNLYVAHYDDRDAKILRHYNEGETPPNWTSGDPRVISFGSEFRNSADPIPHTLSGYGNRKIIVDVMDQSGNVGQCTRTINSIAPMGTITGNVYQNEWGECNGYTEPPTGWRVTCKHAEWSSAVDAVVTGNQYQCVDSTGEPEIDQGLYVIEAHLDDLVDDGWSLISNAEDPICGYSSGGIVSINTTNIPEYDGPDFYLWQGASAWFQTKEGDVHAQGGTISSPIYPEDVYFSIADGGDYPGLVSYNDSEPDFGRGDVSEKGWLADDGFSVIYRYTSLKGKVNPPEGDNFDGNLDYITDRPDQGVFYSPGSVEVSDNKWETDFPSDRKVIIFIEGSLDIKKEVHVPVGSFLAFIVKEDISISGQIGDKQLAVGDPHIQGVYITDGEIGTYAEPDPSGLGSGKRLVAAGIFVAGGGFSLERNLKDDCTGICNETTPAELFIARPDLFINIPDELKESYFFEQEVAP